MENCVCQLAEAITRIRLTPIIPRPTPYYASSNCHNLRIANATHEVLHGQ